MKLTEGKVLLKRKNRHVLD